MKGQYICCRHCRDTVPIVLFFVFGIPFLSVQEPIEELIGKFISRGTFLYLAVSITAYIILASVIFFGIGFIMKLLPKDTPRSYSADIDGFEIADHHGRYFFGYDDTKSISCRRINSGRVMMRIKPKRGRRRLFYERLDKKHGSELIRLYDHINNTITVYGRKRDHER